MDVIIVPGLTLTEDGRARGLLHNRLAMARVLLNEGVAPRILVTGGKPKSGVTEAARMVEIAVGLGIPRERILVEPLAMTSVENGELAAELMQLHGLSSGLVVTDAFHLMYALPVFRDAFEARGLGLFWSPVDNQRLDDLGIEKAFLAAL